MVIFDSDKQFSNMRKIFTLLLSILLTSALSQVVAQRNIYVWNQGHVSVITPARVDSVTSKLYKPFRFTASTVSVTESGFEATGDVELSEGIKSLVNPVKIGVCYSSSNMEPTVSDRTMSLSSNFGEQTISVSGLAGGVTYYYRVYATFLGVAYYGDVCTATTKGDKPADNSKTINGHRFVDLGLPSGLLWAETNLGAEKREDDGNYYAWGETETKDSYTKANATWYDIVHSGNLTATEDAATVNWGSEVRMPTDEDFKELLNTDNCTWTWQEVNGKAGYLVVSKQNGNDIFFPAAGYYNDKKLSNNGTYGYYWSSTPYSPRVSGSYYLYLYAYGNCVEYFICPYTGYSVRAVAE